MSELKFKVGDVVRVKEGSLSTQLVGLTGEVVGIDEGDLYLPYDVYIAAVHYDEWFDEDELERIEE